MVFFYVISCVCDLIQLLSDYVVVLKNNVYLTSTWCLVSYISLISWWISLWLCITNFSNFDMVDMMVSLILHNASPLLGTYRVPPFALGKSMILFSSYVAYFYGSSSRSLLKCILWLINGAFYEVSTNITSAPSRSPLHALPLAPRCPTAWASAPYRSLPDAHYLAAWAPTPLRLVCPPEHDRQDGALLKLIGTVSAWSLEGRPWPPVGPPLRLTLEPFLATDLHWPALVEVDSSRPR